MRLRSGYERKRARVEMLPLIDIVFLLLVFFIYAMLSMVVYRGLKVELPEASTAVVRTEEHVNVTITAGNVLFVEGTEVAPEGLVRAVRVAMAGRGDVPVSVDGDTGADLGMGIRVLDLLRRAGIEEVSLRCKEPGQ